MGLDDFIFFGVFIVAGISALIRLFSGVKKLSNEHVESDFGFSINGDVNNVGIMEDECVRFRHYDASRKCSEQLQDEAFYIGKSHENNQEIGYKSITDFDN